MKNTATIRDIAAKANVSHVTVSNAINGTGRVSESTAEYIRALAKRMGYVPHASARSLRLGKTKTISYLTNHSLHFPYVYEFVEELQKYLIPYEYHLRLELLQHFPDPGIVYHKLSRAICDGVIVHNADENDCKHIRDLKRRDIPVVAVMTRGISGVDYVDYDVKESARLGMDHLLSVGCRNIVIVGVGVKDRQHNPQRLSGCREALNAYGLPMKDSDVFGWDVDEDPIPLWECIKKRRPLPDGIFSSNEDLALALMKKILASGYRIPNEIAMVAQGNTRNLRYADVPLSAVDNNYAKLAQAAAETLLSRIKGGDAKNRRIIIAPKLIVRPSSRS